MPTQEKPCRQNWPVGTKMGDIADMLPTLPAKLDNETGDLLEYRHLMKHPKYTDVWSNSFGKEIRRLVTTTETMSFKSKSQIPQE